MRFIGDVHGKFKRYTKIVKACDESIQVGDFGMGFSGGHAHPLSYREDRERYKHHRFIRGNHDAPHYCANQGRRWWIPDGTIENGMMFIGGALSIDQATRLEGVSWWRDEELSYTAFNKLIDKYERERPLIMVTHECPQSVAQAVFEGRTKTDIPSRTRQAFDALFGMHAPKLWVFGIGITALMRLLTAVASCV